MHALAARSQSLKAKSQSNHPQLSPTPAVQPEGGEVRLLPTTNLPEQLDVSAGIRAMLDPAQSQRAREGEYSMARRRWQQGTVYPRRSKTLPDAWWGRYVETVQSENGAVMRVHRNVFLGEAGSKDGQITKPLAKRALRDYVDRANNHQPVAARSRTIGKAATPFSVFTARWQEEVLVHKKASTA